VATDTSPDLVVPASGRRVALDAVAADYRALSKPGSFPVSEAAGSVAIPGLLDETRGGGASALAFAGKCRDGPDRGRQPLVTVRGAPRPKDGGIHADRRPSSSPVIL